MAVKVQELQGQAEPRDILTPGRRELLGLVRPYLSCREVLFVPAAPAVPEKHLDQMHSVTNRYVGLPGSAGHGAAQPTGCCVALCKSISTDGKGSCKHVLLSPAIFSSIWINELPAGQSMLPLAGPRAASACLCWAQ